MEEKKKPYHGAAAAVSITATECKTKPILIKTTRHTPHRMPLN
jgi:hypothetical protein